MTKFEESIASFDGVKVLILGDIMLDRYWTGEVNRISPEAPVPVLELSTTEDRAGGAANVAVNIKALGGIPFLCSIVGKDAEGEILKNLLEAHHIAGNAIIVDDERPTTLKTRLLSGNHQILRIDKEDRKLLASLYHQLVYEKIIAILDKNDIRVIILQDYNKGFFNPALISEIISEANVRNIKTAVDPKLNHFFDFRKVTLFKPNLKEIRESLDPGIQATLPSLTTASRRLREKLQHRQTFITLSDKGIFVEDETSCALIPTKQRSIADVSGAGDTVISVAALGIATNLDLHSIAVIANAAGGQVCESPGVIAVNKQELIKELNA